MTFPATPPCINTTYRTARDMWSLLRPRISNLEEHGIHDTRIKALQQRGTEGALNTAEQALQGSAL